MAEDNNEIMPWWLVGIIIAAPSGFFLIYLVMDFGSVQNVPWWAWLTPPAAAAFIIVFWYFKSRRDKHR